MSHVRTETQTISGPSAGIQRHTRSVMTPGYIAAACTNDFRVDVLIKVKPKVIEGTHKKSSSSTLLDDLAKLATLAESLTQQRPRANKGWLALAEALDREGPHSGVLGGWRSAYRARAHLSAGVHLWNVSSQLCDVADGDVRSVYASGESCRHLLLVGYSRHWRLFVPRRICGK